MLDARGDLEHRLETRARLIQTPFFEIQTADTLLGDAAKPLIARLQRRRCFFVALPGPLTIPARQAHVPEPES